MTDWRVPYTTPDLPPLEDFEDAVRSMWKTHRISNYGPFALGLESAAEAWTGVPTLAVSSGDMALRILMRLAAEESVGTVIVSDWTFQSTINAVIDAGLRPIIAGVDPETLFLDVSPKILDVPVLATLPHGSTVGVPALRRHCKKSRVPLYLDAAHAFRPEAPVCDGAAFSLSGTKIVVGGEGGLLALPGLREDELRVAERLRNYGFLENYNASHVGMNGKMSELHAALASLSMQGFLRAAQRRRRLFAEYKRQLRSVSVLFQRFALSDVPKDVVVRFKDAEKREWVEDELTHASVETKRYFFPLSAQPAYERWHPGEEIAKASAALWSRTLCLPLSSVMTIAQVRYVCRFVLEVLR